MTELRTARLLLRTARPGDLDDLHAVLSDPAAMRYWSRIFRTIPARTGSLFLRKAPPRNSGRPMFAGPLR
ncbi:MAG: GNAT family N-acetyltransferase [Pseudomonadota bacterium]